MKRPQLRQTDRLFWILLTKLWKVWRPNLVLVKPATVVGWHRKGFKFFWKWRSRTRRRGRPAIPRQLMNLIRRMARENPLWSPERIESERALLGHDVAEGTVAKYMGHRRSGSPSWLTFLRNHLPETAACDFFTIPTATFRVLYCFLVLSHDRRRIIHFNVTANPSAEWTAQRIIEAFPGDGAVPRFLIRDRDGIYGGYFRRRVQNMGIREIITSRKSPWQNPFVERVIGTIRSECLDHVIVLGEDHLRRLLKSYLHYYDRSRPHLSLERNTPVPRNIEPSSRGRVIAIAHIGGLHHRYE
ncbi:MAG: integrase core domain-containing protein, partial [Deltaproteobacteria bacterium]|nr:integrase core domain-containing protein [Deltaproteobacteria bacterium]